MCTQKEVSREIVIGPRRAIHHARHGLTNLLATTTWEEFHHFLIRDSMDRVFADFTQLKTRRLTILAICADWKEASTLRQFPFETITLTGLLPADAKMREFLEQDSRIRYEQQNAESLRFESQSFDIVFCKEGLHHLARPVLGFYEMLRTCRTAVVFIEGYDGWLNRRLERAGLSSIYETDQAGNIGQRRNYVFRWGRRLLEELLNSYYLDSGWTVSLVSAWMGSRVQFGKRTWLRRVGVTAGWILSFLPGFEGNYLTVIIRPGGDLPVDPRPILRT
jgi:SAM-dependent methyltransferase